MEIILLETNCHLAQLVGLSHGGKAVFFSEFRSSNPVGSFFFLFFFPSEFLSFFIFEGYVRVSD